MRTKEEIEERLIKAQSNALKWLESYDKYKLLNDSEAMNISYNYYEKQMEEVYALQWVINKWVIK